MISNGLWIRHVLLLSPFRLLLITVTIGTGVYNLQTLSTERCVRPSKENLGPLRTPTYRPLGVDLMLRSIEVPE